MFYRVVRSLPPWTLAFLAGNPVAGCGTETEVDLNKLKAVGRTTAASRRLTFRSRASAMSRPVLTKCCQLHIARRLTMVFIKNGEGHI